MNSTLINSAVGLAAQIDEKDNEITANAEKGELLRAERLALAQELGPVERALDAGGIPLPYGERRGV
jgi:hypothetical protein